LSSIDVFLDFEIKFSFFTIHGLFKSTIQKSASLPMERLPLSIFSIFAGLQVKALIIVSSLTEPL
jgi:thiamine transporter ThiT